MYAIVQIGGHQYRVAEGDLIYVDRQPQNAGDDFSIDQVLMINDGNGSLNIGSPVVEGASVTATIVDHVKADKVIVFKKKRRKGYRKKNGHRQPMSQIKIESIASSGTKKTKPKKAKKKKEDKKTAAEQNQQLSTDMTAKEAISHINDTSLDKLKGFVPDDEDRVTVQDAWESKQEKPKKAEKEETKKETSKQKQQLSTDMTAKEAAEHIKNTPLDKLKGFVPDDEDRVTVQKAWESKSSSAKA